MRCGGWRYIPLCRRLRNGRNSVITVGVLRCYSIEPRGWSMLPIPRPCVDLEPVNIDRR